jgi:hypothetical protein
MTNVSEPVDVVIEMSVSEACCLLPEVKDGSPLLTSNSLDTSSDIIVENPPSTV